MLRKKAFAMKKRETKKSREILAAIDKKAFLPQQVNFDSQILDFCCSQLVDSSFLVAAAGISGVVSCFSQSVSTDTTSKSLLFKLFTASKDKSWKLTDTETQKTVLANLTAHNSAINSLLTLNEKLIATGDEDGCVKVLWDVTSGKQVQEFEEHSDFVSDMTFVDVKKTLLTVG
ncbi:hypothetical protein HK096_004212 [Nowakowskiella sp. JEL0078]|nr:hypothetical protein HK096_004212 [Nowakowskiella sp. JEL0078]